MSENDDRVVPVPPENTAEEIAKFHEGGADYFQDVCPPPLSLEQLMNSRLLPDRVMALDVLPKGGMCAEVGTQTGFYAKEIMQRIQPEKLHIYDIDFTPFDQDWFQSDLEQGKVELHEGDSSTLLSATPDVCFDYIYIDGDHSYEGVRKDLLAAKDKLADDGIIVCNDYTVYSPLESHKYGIPRAVNEFVSAYGFEVLYLALHPWGYHDIALCRQGAPVSLNLSVDT